MEDTFIAKTYDTLVVITCILAKTLQIDLSKQV